MMRMERIHSEIRQTVSYVYFQFEDPNRFLILDCSVQYCFEEGQGLNPPVLLASTNVCTKGSHPKKKIIREGFKKKK